MHDTPAVDHWHLELRVAVACFVGLQIVVHCAPLFGDAERAPAISRAASNATEVSAVVTWPDYMRPLAVATQRLGDFHLGAPSGLVDELPKRFVRPGELYVTALPDHPRIFEGEHQGFRVLIGNASDLDAELWARDGVDRYVVVHEALAPSGVWRPIEFLPQADCGNSWYEARLPAGRYQDFVVPRYDGSFPTRMRIRVATTHYRRTIYSNEFEGRIDLRQLVRHPDADFLPQ